MNKNSYVTAGLFVVFVMLTVVYWNSGDVPDMGPTALTGDMLETDSPSAEELVANELEIDDEEVANTETGEEQEEQEEQEIEGEEGTETTFDAVSEESNSMQVLRSERERQRSEQVSSLMEIIASADHDAEAKSAAKDSLTGLDKVSNSQRTLESTIRTMGYSDALVRANENSVTVIVQVTDLDSVPTKDEVAELYVVAGLEFVDSDNISIQFQPLN